MGINIDKLIETELVDLLEDIHLVSERNYEIVEKASDSIIQTGHTRSSRKQRGKHGNFYVHAHVISHTAA